MSQREISRSEVEERRALMRPQELKAMGPDREVFLFEGIPHPVQCDKIKYYQDKLFTKRLIGKTNVPVLDLSIKQPPKAVTPTKQAQPAPQTEQTATQSDQASAAIDPNQHTLGDDDMNLKQLAAAATLMGAVATGACSPESLLQPTHNSAGEKVVTGEAFDITQNPNPQKAYKLKVKIKDAPAGGFKDFRAVASFDIGNIKECGYYLGGTYQGTVPGVERDILFPLIKLSETEYEGVFYTDWGKDGDFYGKGVCHWVFTYIGVSFRATGAEDETQFITGFSDNYEFFTGKHVVRGTDDEFDSKHSKTQTRFYPKSEYPRSQFHNTSSSDSGLKSVNEYTEKYRNNLFSLTLTTEKVE